MSVFRFIGMAAVATLVLSGCGGSSSSTPPAGYSVGGTVAGLAGSGLKLRNNGGDEISVAPGATTFTFPTRMGSGAPYAVTVSAMPASPSQSCAVTGGTGTIGSADVTSVAVTCTTRSFTVGGAVTGLQGSGLVLQLNGGGNLAVPASASSFTFAAPVPSGQVYVVTVLTQPSSPTQSCTVANGGGTMGAADVANITVACSSNTYSIGGTVTGLQGSGLVLHSNLGEDLPIAGTGTVAFTFSTKGASGSPFAVTVATHPSSPPQTCSVVNGAGTLAGADVNNVIVNCSAATYTVGGTVSGLTGAGLVLQLNGAYNLAVAGAGPFTFASAPLASGTPYTVSVLGQPSGPSQTCAVTASATGTVGSGPVTDVAVTCTTNTFAVGGTVGGLAGSGLVLQLNGAGNLPVASGATTFAFPGVASGAPFAVTVLTQPTSPAQTCAVTANGTGIVGNEAVTNVAVTCTTSGFAVGGTIANLVGSGLVLRLTPTPGSPVDLPVSGGATTFAFPPLPSGSSYAVTVLAQPTGPSQSCAVTANGSGTVGSQAVTDVAVACTTNTYAVGGNVTGLAGSGLVLQLNGANDLAVAGTGTVPFGFASAPVASGASYAVTVLTQPTSPSQTCTATANGSGTIGGAAVTDVSVTCTTNTYAVGGNVTNLVGSGLVLRLTPNPGSPVDLPVSAGATTFAFPPIASGTSFTVSVPTQPTNPTQTCTVTGNGTGTVGGAPVTSVAITCETSPVIQRWAAPSTWGGTAQGFWPDDDPALVQHAVFTSSGVVDRFLTWETPPAGINFRQFTGFGPALTRWGAGFAGTTSALRTTPFAEPTQNPLNALTGNMIACAVIKPDWNPQWDGFERVILANGIQGESGWVLMQMHQAWCFHYQGVTMPVVAYDPGQGTMNYANTWFNNLNQDHAPWSQTGPLNSSFVVVCGGRDDTAGGTSGRIIVAANNFSETQMASVGWNTTEPMALNPHPVTMGNYEPFNPDGSYRNNWNGRVYETAVWNLPATRENVQAKMNAVLGIAPLADGSLPAYRRDTEAPFYGPEATPAYHTAYRHGPRLDAARGLLFGLQGVNHVLWPEALNWWQGVPPAADPTALPTVSADAAGLPFPPGDSELRTGDVVTLPAGASLQIALDPFYNPGRLQGQIWLISQGTGGGTLTIRSEATTTPAGGGTPTVVSRGSQTVSVSGLTQWTRRAITALSAEPPPVTTPPDPAPTFTQTLILQNAGASPITFGAWGISLTQASPAVETAIDLGIANYDTLLGSTITEYLALPPVSASTASGLCLSATVQPANETPWNVWYHRPRTMITLQRTDPGTALQAYAKLQLMAGGMVSDQRICFYVNDGTFLNDGTTPPVPSACADAPVLWDTPTPREHTVKGCVSSTGQMRLYFDGAQVAAATTPVVPNFQGGQALIGSNEGGTHVWSGYVRSAAVCRDDGNLAQCQ
jgi:hypothetical protein